MSNLRGFTLLELVLVVGILAILAGSVIVQFGDVQREAYEGIQRSELHELRDAVLRFHADTGFLPGEGPFNVSDPSVPGFDSRGMPNPPVAGWPDPTVWHAWIRHPANVIQLLKRPDLSSDWDWLEQWDPGRARGWNGPYLKQERVHWVVLSRRVDRSGVDTLDNRVLPPMPALGDVYEAPPADDSEFTWYRQVEPQGVASPSVSTGLFELHGRPYFLLQTSDRHEARVVGFGSDLTYASHEVIWDPVLDHPSEFTPVALDSNGAPLDVGLFLFR